MSFMEDAEAEEAAESAEEAAENIANPVSISKTAAVLYAGCCILFLTFVIFLCFCKVAIIDASPTDRVAPGRYIRGKQIKTLGIC